MSLCGLFCTVFTHQIFEYNDLQLFLAKSSPYFLQFNLADVQYVTERSWSDFVIKGSSNTGCFEKEFWAVTLNKLEAFFDSWIAPELCSQQN